MSLLLNELPEEAVRIDGTLNWIDKNGNIYGIETRMIPSKYDKTVLYPHKNYGKYFKYSNRINKKNGYVYCGIKYILDEETKKYEIRHKRVHILVAKAFIPNPNNFPIVGHKNNIKSDNRVSNLYWTTIKENTQKAVDDGLMVNDMGYEDSQSNPVIMFNTYTNEEIARYGSICIASKETGIPKNTIARQAKYKKPVRKPFYFRYQDDESAQPPVVIAQYDWETHQEINRFFNANEAEKKTGIPKNTILKQCKNNCIPKYSKHKTYFLYKQ